MKKIGMLVVCAVLAGCGGPRLGEEPILESINVRMDTSGYYAVAHPELTFLAPRGDVVKIERKILISDAPGAQVIRGVVFVPGFGLVKKIQVAPEAQEDGSVYVDSWACGSEVYYISVEATLVGSSGGRSKTLPYAIHCNGG